VHFPGFKLTFCTRSWLHVCFFSVFAILFGAFPYSGNLGILVGFFTVPLSVLSFILTFTKYRHEPTTLLIKTSHLHCGCLVDNELFINITRIFSFLAGIFIFIIGLIHVFVTDFNWCPTAAITQCVGPSLRWNPSSVSFIQENNDATGWRQVFTFQIDVFLALWGPTVLGIVSILQHIEGHHWVSIGASWARVFFWYMFVGLFAGLGYTGNLGVLAGFFCVLISLMACAITFGGGVNTRTHLEIRMMHYGKGQVTMITGGMQRDTIKGKEVEIETHPLMSSIAVTGDIRAEFDYYA